MSIAEVISAYDRAWNEPRVDRRRRLLETALTDACELIEPRGRFSGRKAIIERLGGFSQRFPGATVSITTGIDQHNGFARYGWQIADGAGAAVLDGIDIVELAEDGRLKSVVMFFGPLSAA